MNKYYVYKHTTPSNKIYIGITANKPQKRWGGGANYKNQHFHNAIKKYGWDNIKHEILFEGLTKELAEQKEIELIKLYDTTNPNKGYNETNGGNCRVLHTEETKEKMRLSRQGKKHNAQWVENQKKSISKIQGVEVIAIKGNIIIMEFKSIMEASRYAGVCEATMRGCLNGKQSNVKGIVYKYKDIKKQKNFISKRKYKIFKCLETNKIYTTIRQAANEINICESSIDKVLKGKRKTAGGFRFVYIGGATQ